MQVSVNAIINDPALYLHQFQEDHAQLLEMRREAFERSIFLDDRVEHDSRDVVSVPLNDMLPRYQGPSMDSREIGFIFHVAQCGSTLLARALDLPGRSLVLREPLALRQLGVGAGADANRALVMENIRFREVLMVTLNMLGKRWEQDRPVIVKANVPVNYIAPEIMAHYSNAAAITLHFPLEEYVAAIMRTEGHEQWVERVYAELRLAGGPLLAGMPTPDTASRAAALWFTQMKAFEQLLARFPRVRSLSAGVFFADPAAAIGAAAELFGVELAAGEADEIAAGELFQTYSKNPTLDYDPEVRFARETEAKQRLSGQIAIAREWALVAKEKQGLPDALASPLLGDPVQLLG